MKTQLADPLCRWCLGLFFEGSLFVGVSKGRPKENHHFEGAQPFRRQHTKAKWSPESGSLQLCRRQLGIRRLAAVLAPADRRLLVVLGGKPGELHEKKNRHNFIIYEG